LLSFLRLVSEIESEHWKTELNFEKYFCVSAEFFKLSTAEEFSLSESISGSRTSESLLLKAKVPRSSTFIE
jgi:hypothetical protein